MTTITIGMKVVDIDHSAPFGVIDELPAQVVANITMLVMDGYEFGNYYFTHTKRSYPWKVK